MGFTVTVPNGGSDSASFYNFSGANLGQIVGTDLGGGVGTLTFKTNSNANSIVMDQNGSLGFNGSPSAWGTGRGGIELFGSVQPSVSFSGPTPNNGGSINTNTYNNGSGWLYKNTGYASLYQTVNGGFQWYTAPSGSAGGTVSLTQALTLTNGGNLLLGTASNSYGNGNTLEISGSSQSTLTLSNGSSPRMYFYASSSESRIASYGTTPLTFYGNGNEYARVDTSGNLLVGVTSGGNSGGATQLNVTGTTLSTYYAYNAATNTVGVGTGNGGGILIIRGYDTGSGQAFCNLYIAAVRVGGGGGSDQLVSGIATQGVSKSFSFSSSGGYLVVTPPSSTSYRVTFIGS